MLIFISALFIILSCSTTHATDTTVDYNVNIAPSLNVDLSSSSVVLNLNPNTKTFGYQDVDVTVSTNYEAGYELKMSTSDNSTNLKRDNTADGVNASINTLTATSPTTTGYTDSDFSNCTTSNCLNKWGYKNGLSNNYFPFTSGATILSNTIATNADTTTLRFAAKIDYDLPAGAYNNELIFAATANPITYNITYYDLVGVSATDPTKQNDAGLTWNNPTTGTAKVASYEQIAEQNNTSGTSAYVNLNPSYISGHSTPTRHTYTFAGWCLDPNKTVTADQDTSNKVTAYHNPSTQCNGTIYQTGDPIPLTPNDANNISIYAMWTPTTFAEAGVTAGDTMQTITATKCSNTSPNQFTTMRDSRDNGANTYTIIKLMDGRCWMADNLSFDAYTYKNNITASNTHVENTTVGTSALNAFKNGGGTASDQYATSAINSSSTYVSGGNWTAAYSYSDPLINKSGRCDATISATCNAPPPGVTDGYDGNNYNYNTVIDKFCLNNDGTICMEPTGTANTYYAYGPGTYKIGIYYNYCATSLGSYCWGNGASWGSLATGDATSADVCPANWKLPTGGSNGEFKNLYNEINKLTTSPENSTNVLSLQTMLSTPFVGGYNGDVAYRHGVFAFFWSSTYVIANHMDILRTSGIEVVTPHNNGGTRAYGVSVRCIAQN